MASLNAHGLGTMKKYYAIRKALIQAYRGKAITEAVLEGSVPWPEGALDASAVDRRIAELAKSFGRKVKDAADDTGSDVWMAALGFSTDNLTPLGWEAGPSADAGGSGATQEEPEGELEAEDVDRVWEVGGPLSHSSLFYNSPGSQNPDPPPPGPHTQPRGVEARFR